MKKYLLKTQKEQLNNNTSAEIISPHCVMVLFSFVQQQYTLLHNKDFLPWLEIISFATQQRTPTIIFLCSDCFYVFSIHQTKESKDNLIFTAVIFTTYTNTETVEGIKIWRIVVIIGFLQVFLLVLPIAPSSAGPGIDQ